MELLTNYILITLTILAIVLSFFAGRQFRSIELKHDLESLARLKETYQTRSGWTESSDYYLLFSFDAGKSWYAMDKEGTTIIGPAEEIYPGITELLESENSLIRYPDSRDDTHNT